MSRSFAAVDLVTLPRLSVADAIVLGTELCTWADSITGLPTPVRKALQRLRETLGLLREAAKGRIEKAILDTRVAQEADRIVDLAWAAGYHWCNGWARLPNAPEYSEPATEIRDVVFSDGLKFTTLKYREQWVESQARLDVIEARGMDKLFAGLGGQAILAGIRDAHRGYGEALGITTADIDDAVLPGERLLEFLEALRHYVVRVSAYVEPDDMATLDTAEHLLTPLRQWKRSPAPSSGTGEDTEPSQDPETAETAGQPEPDTRAVDTMPKP